MIFFDVVESVLHLQLFGEVRKITPSDRAYRDTPLRPHLSAAEDNPFICC